MAGLDQSDASEALLRVLQKVCLGGKDAFTEALGSQTFKVARLVSKALRDVVDGSLLNVTIIVAPMHKGLVGRGCRSPLWRWHRLRELTLSVRPDKYDKGGVEAVTLFTLPFVSQPLESLQQIEALRLYAANERPLPTAGLGWLFCRLPNLRYIYFGTILSSEAAQQLLLYNALAPLSRLESLSLPTLFLLQHIGPLADRLKDVEFCDVCSRPDHEALLETDWLIPAVAQLRELRQLKVRFYRGGLFGVAGIVELLHNLPAGLEHLQIALDMLDDPDDPIATDHTVELTFEARRITSVELPVPLLLDRFATFVCAILLPCYRLSPVLPLMRLRGVQVRNNSLSEQQLQQLRELAGRCRRLEVEALYLEEEKVDYQLFLNVIEVLGLPQKVFFVDGISCCQLLGPVPHPAAAAVAGVFRTDTAAVAMLVECRSLECAMMVAMVARLALNVSGGGVGSTAAASVEMCALPAKPLHYWGTASWLWQESFRVLQEFWDSGLGGSEPERLRLLLDLGYLAADGSLVVNFIDQFRIGAGSEPPNGVDQQQE
ncbi:hypothetical protein VOLCADRAFT_96672 [Volvox carteri f. nagariensis]|uniref:Uncharacterized protein n=1 Tax=Volvox carteri f. nagariensis TaxID=3068 RepID=D8UAR3_VOLCA|nr:uncharacterized protein VOLCADRAFT_96672 [Volvox carteri f. nagariensis]EFJ43201.1 hypothetical protein VOLCADRAFT_96672 [Volvox carteri f. nagariensis]|eukprot:XP_002955776.1 hypothetical protein VOLCADRAFT_96672 [Volvox carteri f. nagariensis]